MAAQGLREVANDVFCTLFGTCGSGRSCYRELATACDGGILSRSSVFCVGSSLL